MGLFRLGSGRTKVRAKQTSSPELPVLQLELPSISISLPSASDIFRQADTSDNSWIAVSQVKRSESDTFPNARLSPDDLCVLLKTCGRAIKERAVETPGLFRPYRLGEDRAKCIKCCKLFLAAVKNDRQSYADFMDELSWIGPHDLVVILKWGLRRLVFPVPFSGSDKKRDLSFWPIHKTSRQSFETLLRSLPETSSRLLTLTLDLISTVLARNEYNGTTTRRICRTFGMFLFGLAPPEKRWTSFESLLRAYESAGEVMEGCLRDYVKAGEGMPSRLVALLQLPVEARILPTLRLACEGVEHALDLHQSLLELAALVDNADPQSASLSADEASRELWEDFLSRRDPAQMWMDDETRQYLRALRESSESLNGSFRRRSASMRHDTISHQSAATTGRRHSLSHDRRTSPTWSTFALNGFRVPDKEVVSVLSTTELPALPRSQSDLPPARRDEALRISSVSLVELHDDVPDFWLDYQSDPVCRNWPKVFIPRVRGAKGYGALLVVRSDASTASNTAMARSVSGPALAQNGKGTSTALLGKSPSIKRWNRRVSNLFSRPKKEDLRPALPKVPSSTRDEGLAPPQPNDAASLQIDRDTGDRTQPAYEVRNGRDILSPVVSDAHEIQVARTETSATDDKDKDLVDMPQPATLDVSSDAQDQRLNASASGPESTASNAGSSKSGPPASPTSVREGPADDPETHEVHADDAQTHRLPTEEPSFEACADGSPQLANDLHAAALSEPMIDARETEHENAGIEDDAHGATPETSAFDPTAQQQETTRIIGHQAERSTHLLSEQLASTRPPFAPLTPTRVAKDSDDSSRQSHNTIKAAPSSVRRRIQQLEASLKHDEESKSTGNPRASAKAEPLEDCNDASRAGPAIDATATPLEIPPDASPIAVTEEQAVRSQNKDDVADELARGTSRPASRLSRTTSLAETYATFETAETTTA